MTRQHRWRLACAAALMWIAGAVPAFAQPDLSRTIGSTVADRPSASYVFSALRLDSADGQRHYRVRIATPKLRRRLRDIRWCICWMAMPR